MSLMVKMLNVTRMNLIYKISLTFLFAIASNLFSISEESYTFQYKESEFKVNIINLNDKWNITYEISHPFFKLSQDTQFSYTNLIQVSEIKRKLIVMGGLRKIEESYKLDHVTKEIEYITSNKEGDIFKILAKFGKSNIKNSDILDLEYVDGLISSKKRSQIFISSNFAKYNYNNRNSQFYDNVQIKYDNKLITCDNLDLKINENYAVAYNNVIIKDNKSIMKAQMVTLNIITKDIKINSQNKVEIITN